MGTSPDLYLPPNAFTGSTIADMQDVTEEGAVAAANGDVIDMMDAVFDALIDNLFGGFGDVIQAIGAGIGEFISDLVEIFSDILSGVPIIGGVLSDLADALSGLKGDVDDAGTRAADAELLAQNSAAAVYNGWFGGSTADGTPTEVLFTVETIKATVVSGFTVETKTSSGTWTKPDGITELVVILVGGGRSGTNGTPGTNNLVDAAKGGAGGIGGSDGGYLAQQIDPASVGATVSYTVAAAGNNNSSFGPLTSSPGASGISSSFGFSATTSRPGSGGNGGFGGGSNSPSPTNGSAGTAGTSSALGAGGAGGAGDPVHVGGGPHFAGTGVNGGNVSAATVTKCGGGGGGGGGGAGQASASTTNGGNGGTGGYPGGGGGAGGGGGGYASAGGASNVGTGGAGANGIIWIYYR